MEQNGFIIDTLRNNKRNNNMTTLSIEEFDSKMKELLLVPGVVEHLEVDNYQNGLATQGSGSVSKIGFGVSASLDLFHLAAKAGCGAIVVHHGLALGGPLLDDITYHRLAYLIKNDIALWGAHFALDAHPELGNAAQILIMIGATTTDAYFDKEGPWGRVADVPSTTLDAVVSAMGEYVSPSTVVYDYGNKEIKRVACITGSGGPSLADITALKNDGVDLFITGVAYESHRDAFKEAGMNFIAAGHYHTEMVGVQALQKVVEEEWGVETVWLDVENVI